MASLNFSKKASQVSSSPSPSTSPSTDKHNDVLEQLVVNQIENINFMIYYGKLRGRVDRSSFGCKQVQET